MREYDYDENNERDLQYYGWDLPMAELKERERVKNRTEELMKLSKEDLVSKLLNAEKSVDNLEVELDSTSKVMQMEKTKADDYENLYKAVWKDREKSDDVPF